MFYKRIDLLNQRFGKLTVISFCETRNGQAYWKCKCDCGTEIIARGSHLRAGNVKSCGCLVVAENKQRATHNLSRSSIYNIYHSIRKRCYVPSTESYPNYGGRGIVMCDQWIDKENGFNEFYNWAITNGYQNDLSIDRIDVDGNYCPENCRWANPKTQANNRRNSIHIELNGEIHTPSEWSEITGIPRATILDRYKRGWTPQKILTSRK